MHDLDETDANRFLTRLHEVNIESVKEKQSNGQWAISVEKSDTISALKYLSDARMFKSTEGTQQKTSLVSSKEDQKFYFERAVSHELERTLSGMPEVLDARVHLNLPASDPIFGNRLPDSKGSGSVLLVVSDSFSANMSQVSELIAGAAGIDKSAISILVSREKPEAIKAEPKQAAVAVAAPPTITTQPAQAAFNFNNTYAYSAFGFLALIGGGAFFTKKVFKKKPTNKSRKLEEEDLYELARDFN